MCLQHFQWSSTFFFSIHKGGRTCRPSRRLLTLNRINKKKNTQYIRINIEVMCIFNILRLDTTTGARQYRFVFVRLKNVNGSFRTVSVTARMRV